MKKQITGFIGIAGLAVLAFSMSAIGMTRDLRVGRVEGVTMLQENGSPLGKAIVTLESIDHPSEWTGSSPVTRTDEGGRFKFSGVPEGKYKLLATGNAHASKEQTIEVAEGERKIIQLEMEPQPESLRLDLVQSVFTPDESPSVQVFGFTQSSVLEASVYKVTPEELISRKSLWSAASHMKQLAEKDVSQIQSNLAQAATWTITNKDSEGSYEQSFSFNPLPEGVYLIRLHCRTMKDTDLNTFGLVTVTKIGAVVKSDGGTAHLFVTDIKTGMPIPGASAQIIRDSGGQKAGTTDKNGLLTVKLPPREGNESDAAILVTAGTSTALVGASSYVYGGDGQVFIQTDRPIYRPGDEVQFRAILRLSKDASLSRPTPGTPVTVLVEDSDGNKLKSLSVPLSQFGTISGEVLIPETEGQGIDISVQMPKVSGSTYVPVSAYRKPPFKITVSPDQPMVYRGDRARMKVKCEYYYGAPAAGVKLSSTVSTANLWTWDDPESEETYADSYGYEYRGSVEGVTNEKGEAILEYDTSQIVWQEEENADQELKFEVEADAGDDRYFSGSGAVKLVRGDVDLRVETDSWMTRPKEAFNVTVRTLNPADGKPIPNQSVTVLLRQMVYRKDGQYPLDAGRRTITTGADGTAALKLTADEAGYYQVIGSVFDSRHREIHSAAYIDSFAEGYSWPQESDLTVVLDHKSYNGGDPILAVIRTKAQDGAAWVTLEGTGILQEQLVTIKNGLAEVHLTAPKLDAPNAIVSVSMIKNKQLLRKDRSFKLSLNSHKLNIELSPRSKKLHPGDKLEIGIKTTDDKGNPVPSEVGVGLVDESVYAVLEDTSDPTETFFPRLYSNVSLSYSFESVYLDGGDKGEQKTELRTDFRDTAAWRPSVVTDSKGEASVEIKLPDNLTTWRATAVGITEGSSVGKSKAFTRVAKDLMISLSLPQSLTQFDNFQVSGTITNTSAETQTVQPALQSQGAELVSSPTGKLTLKPDESAIVKWTLKAPHAGLALLTASVRADSGLSDAMRDDVKILPLGVKEVQSDSGQLSSGDSAEMNLVLQPNSEMRELKINAAPSLMGSVLGNLESLVDYPYGCTEQTLSRFVPALQVRHALTSLGKKDAKLEAKIDEVSRQSIARLKNFQHSDGGWGWWEEDESTEIMTGMVLEGLFEAKAAGTAYPDSGIDRALDWAQAKLKEPVKIDKYFDSTPDRVWLAYAVLLWREDENASKVLLSAPKKDAGVQELAQRFQALCRLSIPGAETARNRVWSRLRKLATEENGGLVFVTDWWCADASARVLDGLAAIDPTGKDTQALVRGILRRRKGNGWYSTYETNQSIAALAAVAAKTGELTNPSDITITVGTETKTVHFDPAGTNQTESLILTGQQLDGIKSVSIKSNSGVAYWDASLSQYAVSENVPDHKSESISVERTFHTVSQERKADGKFMEVLGRPRNEFASGDVVRCHVVVRATRPQRYVLVEIPLPSNMHILESENPESWFYWFNGIQIFNDRAALFSDVVTGVSEFDISLKAETPGISFVNPARAEPMYDPAKAGWSSSQVVTIK